MREIAYFGGEKTVNISQPHFTWPDVKENEIKAVIDTLLCNKNGNYGTKAVVEVLEENFRKYHNIDYSLALNSATSCLHTAYYALGIGIGDEVIVPNYTFRATALPLLVLGATPILCDCLRDTANIDPEQIRKKITKRTKAIAVTHLWGHPCEMDAILDISNEHGIPVVEDCAHSVGAKYKDQLLGTIGTIGCFSFDNNKIMASGEGGMLITNDQEVFEKAVIFSDFAGRLSYQVKKPENKKYADTGIGLKYRIHPLAAAIANEKLKILDKELNKNRILTLDYFSQKLNETVSISPPVTKENVVRGGYYGYKPIYDGKRLGNLPILKFIEMLQAEGVDVRQTVSPPLHRTHLFSDSKNYSISLNNKYEHEKFAYSDLDFPNSVWFHENHLSFATFSRKSDRTIIDLYIEAIHKVENYLLHKRLSKL